MQRGPPTPSSGVPSFSRPPGQDGSSGSPQATRVVPHTSHRPRRPSSWVAGCHCGAPQPSAVSCPQPRGERVTPYPTHAPAAPWQRRARGNRKCVTQRAGRTCTATNGTPRPPRPEAEAALRRTPLAVGAAPGAAEGKAGAGRRGRRGGRGSLRGLPAPRAGGGARGPWGLPFVAGETETRKGSRGRPAGTSSISRSF